MGQLTNPYAFTITGAPVFGQPAPELRAEGAPMSQEQIGMARNVYQRFVDDLRVSALPFHAAAGQLPDGSLYRITAMGGQRIVQVWPTATESPTDGVVAGPGILFGDPVLRPDGFAFYVLTPPGGGSSGWRLLHFTGWPVAPVNGPLAPSIDAYDYATMTSGIRATAPAGYFYRQLHSEPLAVMQLGGFVRFPTNGFDLGVLHFVGTDAQRRALALTSGGDGLRLFRSSAPMALENTGENAGLRSGKAAPWPVFPSLNLSLVSSIYPSDTVSPDEQTTRRLVIPANLDGTRMAVRVRRVYDRAPVEAAYYDALPVLGNWEPRFAEIRYADGWRYRTEMASPFSPFFVPLRFRRDEVTMQVRSTATGAVLQEAVLPQNDMTPAPVFLTPSVSDGAMMYPPTTGSGALADVHLQPLVPTRWEVLYDTGGNPNLLAWTAVRQGPETSTVTSHSTVYSHAYGCFFRGGQFVPAVLRSERSYTYGYVGTINNTASGSDTIYGPPYVIPPRPAYGAGGGPTYISDAKQGEHTLTVTRRDTVDLGPMGVLVLADDHVHEVTQGSSSRLWEPGVSDRESFEISSVYEWSSERRRLLVCDPEMDLLAYTEIQHTGAWSAEYEWERDVHFAGNAPRQSASAGFPLAGLPPARLCIRCRGRTIELPVLSGQLPGADHARAAAELHPALGFAVGSPGFTRAEFGVAEGSSYHVGSTSFPTAGFNWPGSFPSARDGSPMTNLRCDGHPYTLESAPTPTSARCQIVGRGEMPNPTSVLGRIQVRYIRAPDGSGAYLYLRVEDSVPQGLQGFEPRRYVIDATGIRLMTDALAGTPPAGIDWSRAGAF